MNPILLESILLVRVVPRFGLLEIDLMNLISNGFVTARD